MKTFSGCLAKAVSQAVQVLPLEQVMGYPLVNDAPDNSDLLIQMARHAWVKKLVSVDAFVVLCGAVLTSYVGIIGLLRRLAMDRCLPAFLLSQNQRFGSYHAIIVTFFVICTSLYYATGRDVYVLANVYTIAFLSVMSLFVVGNLLLKFKRARLRRYVKAPLVYCVLALAGTITGVTGNVILNINVIQYFFLYYFSTAAVIFFTFNRMRILKLLLHLLLAPFQEQHISLDNIGGLRGKLIRLLVSWQHALGQQAMVYFIKERNIRTMCKTILYVMENEQAERLKFVHFFHPDLQPLRSTMTYSSSRDPSKPPSPRTSSNNLSAAAETGGAEPAARDMVETEFAMIHASDGISSSSSSECSQTAMLPGHAPPATAAPLQDNPSVCSVHDSIGASLQGCQPLPDRDAAPLSGLPPQLEGMARDLQTLQVGAAELRE